MYQFIKHEMEKMNMPVNQYNGKIEGTTKVSDIINYLKDHQKVYGDTPVLFSIEGERDVIVQFDHFKDALTINLEEEYED